MCLLFVAPYAVSFGSTLVLWFLPLACLLPFVVLPLFYTLVHRVDTTLFGRYHLVMPLAGFTAALFFVYAFAATDGGALGACSIFFGLTVFLSSVMIYRYCAFSVRARLLDENIVAASPYNIAFTVLGGIVAIGTFIGFLYYDQATAYINTAYVLASACTVLVIVQYLSTFYSIPQLSGKRVQSVKNVFRSFFSGLDLRMYFSALLFNAVFAVLGASVVFFAYQLGFGALRVAGTAGALVGCYAVAECACVFCVKHRSKGLSIVALTVFCAAAASIAVAASVDLAGGGRAACVVVAAGLVGAGGAIVVRQTKLRFLTVKPRITSGAVFILMELTACAAAAISCVAIAATVAVYGGTGSTLSVLCGCGTAFVLAVAAFAVAGKKRTKPSAAPGLSYEPKTGEIDKSLSIDGESADDESGDDK